MFTALSDKERAVVLYVIFLDYMQPGLMFWVVVLQKLLKIMKRRYNVEDNEIIELYLQRNEEAISQAKLKYTDYCQAIALRILRDKEDTKEALNDTWLAAWNCIPPHIPNCLRTFIGRLTRNICLKMIRSQGAQKRAASELRVIYEEIEEQLASASCIEEQISENELTEALNIFLDSIKTIEREVFVRRYWYMQSVAEIAGIYGFSESKVKSLLFRTRKKLYEKLRKEGFI